MISFAISGRKGKIGTSRNTFGAGRHPGTSVWHNPIVRIGRQQVRKGLQNLAYTRSP